MEKLLTIERRLWKQDYRRVMGLDEVGRGCLSGPVVAAGVIFEKDVDIHGISDSKQLSAAERDRLATIIRKEALYWTICSCKPEEIDEMNILYASIHAMMKCVESDGANPDFLLVDGNRFTATILPFECVVKGDRRSLSIAAASILAKVHRDRLMHELHVQYPYYGWNTNVGYPTRIHYEGLRKHGYTRHHRKSFNLRTNRTFEG